MQAADLEAPKESDSNLQKGFFPHRPSPPPTSLLCECCEGVEVETQGEGAGAGYRPSLPSSEMLRIKEVIVASGALQL